MRFVPVIIRMHLRSTVSVMNMGYLHDRRKQSGSDGTWDIAEFTGDHTDIVPHNKPEWLGMMLDRV